MTVPAPAKMSVMVGRKFACIRISGRANFNSSLDFKTLIAELQQKGYAYFVLDLAECTLMDSTFLGVLAGFGLKMSGNLENPDERGIELLNSNNRIVDLLENLGVLHLFRVTQGPLQVPEESVVHDVVPGKSSKEEVTRACLEAHQTLMEINPRNIARFKDVAQFLAEDLKKLSKSS